MPVMKNNYDIYKDTRARSRKTSECSNVSSGNGTSALASALATPGQPSQQQQRRRKVSECKSESFATSPSHGQLGTHRMQMQRCHSSRGFTRNTSRSSHGGSMMQMSQAAMMSPTRSSPPSRTQTASALERQAAAQAAAQSAAAAATAQREERAAEQSNDYTKFHMRLVDKLRKSFRKDSSKRS